VTAFVYSILLVIASQVAYQLAVKSIPRESHPFGVLIIVYGIAIDCLHRAPTELAGRSGSRSRYRALQLSLCWQCSA
jgi:hypothetical protein